MKIKFHEAIEKDVKLPVTYIRAILSNLSTQEEIDIVLRSIEKFRYPFIESDYINIIRVIMESEVLLLEERVKRCLELICQMISKPTLLRLYQPILRTLARYGKWELYWDIFTIMKLQKISPSIDTLLDVVVHLEDDKELDEKKNRMLVEMLMEEVDRNHNSYNHNGESEMYSIPNTTYETLCKFREENGIKKNKKKRLIRIINVRKSEKDKNQIESEDQLNFMRRILLEGYLFPTTRINERELKINCQSYDDVKSSSYHHQNRNNHFSFLHSSSKNHHYYFSNIETEIISNSFLIRKGQMKEYLDHIFPSGMNERKFDVILDGANLALNGQGMRRKTNSFSFPQVFFTNCQNFAFSFFFNLID